MSNPLNPISRNLQEGTDNNVINFPLQPGIAEVTPDDDTLRLINPEQTALDALARGLRGGVFHRIFSGALTYDGTPDRRIQWEEYAKPFAEIARDKDAFVQTYARVSDACTTGLLGDETTRRERRIEGVRSANPYELSWYNHEDSEEGHSGVYASIVVDDELDETKQPVTYTLTPVGNIELTGTFTNSLNNHVRPALNPGEARFGEILDLFDEAIEDTAERSLVDGSSGERHLTLVPNQHDSKLPPDNAA